MENIEELVDAMFDDKTADTLELCNIIFDEKLTSKINDIKDELSKSMFR